MFQSLKQEFQVDHDKKKSTTKVSEQIRKKYIASYYKDALNIWTGQSCSYLRKSAIDLHNVKKNWFYLNETKCSKCIINTVVYLINISSKSQSLLSEYRNILPLITMTYESE